MSKRKTMANVSRKGTLPLPKAEFDRLVRLDEAISDDIRWRRYQDTDVDPSTEEVYMSYMRLQLKDECRVLYDMWYKVEGPPTCEEHSLMSELQRVIATLPTVPPHKLLVGGLGIPDVDNTKLFTYIRVHYPETRLAQFLLRELRTIDGVVASETLSYLNRQRRLMQGVGYDLPTVEVQVPNLATQTYNVGKGRLDNYMRGPDRPFSTEVYMSLDAHEAYTRLALCDTVDKLFTLWERVEGPLTKEDTELLVDLQRHVDTLPTQPDRTLEKVAQRKRMSQTATLLRLAYDRELHKITTHDIDGTVSIPKSMQSVWAYPLGYIIYTEGVDKGKRGAQALDVAGCGQRDPTSYMELHPRVKGRIRWEQAFECGEVSSNERIRKTGRGGSGARRRRKEKRARARLVGLCKRVDNLVRKSKQK